MHFWVDFTLLSVDEHSEVTFIDRDNFFFVLLGKILKMVYAETFSGLTNFFF